jgi:hypothetical protein
MKLGVNILLSEATYFGYLFSHDQQHKYGDARIFSV